MSDKHLGQLVVYHAGHGNYLKALRGDYTKDIKEAFVFNTVEDALRYRFTPSYAVIDKRVEGEGWKYCHECGNAHTPGDMLRYNGQEWCESCYTIMAEREQDI